MSAQGLITSMEKLLKLHKSLYELAITKTDIIKKGDITALDKILKDEQAHIAAISRLEQQRLQEARKLLPEKENPTIADCIEQADEDEQSNLIEITNHLAEVVFNLKKQNYLNQQLIYQSLQFVNLSLNMLRPQPEKINYTPPTKRDTKKDSMFNFRA